MKFALLLFLVMVPPSPGFGGDLEAEERQYRAYLNELMAERERATKPEEIEKLKSEILNLKVRIAVMGWELERARLDSAQVKPKLPPPLEMNETKLVAPLSLKLSTPKLPADQGRPYVRIPLNQWVWVNPGKIGKRTPAYISESGKIFFKNEWYPLRSLYRAYKEDKPVFVDPAFPRPEGESRVQKNVDGSETTITALPGRSPRNSFSEFENTPYGHYAHVDPITAEVSFLPLPNFDVFTGGFVSEAPPPPSPELQPE